MHQQQKKLPLVAIGGLCDFSNGHGFTPDDWEKSGLPIIRIQNLNGSRNFNYYQGEPDRSWIVNPGDLLFAWAGVKGVSFGPTIWNGPQGVLNQHIYRIRPQSHVDLKWLYYVLLEITTEIETKAHGFKTSLVHVHKSDIVNAKVAFTELIEQRKIAAVLNEWDIAIEKTKRLIEVKEKRFSDLASILYRPLSDATVTTFGSFLTESRIPGSNGAIAKKLSVKLYGLGIVEKNEKTAGSLNTTYHVRRSGQLIFSKLDFLNGAFGIVPQELDGYETTLDLPAFDISSTVNAEWLLGYLCRSEYYTRQTGLARGQRKARRIHPNDFLSSTLSLPSRANQDHVADILNIAKTDISITRRLLDAFNKQKRCLMRKLLTGDWRVKTAEEVL